MRVDDPATRRTIAATLPDTPETVISLHALRSGRCRTYLAGPAHDWRALVIESDDAPGEPSCYGDDIDAIWAILSRLPDWFAANLREPAAHEIGARIVTEWGEQPNQLGDLHFTLNRPAPALSNPAVRLLTPADEGLLAAADPHVRGSGFDTPQELLADGIAAAAIVNDRIAAIAHTSAISERHADIAVSTLEEYRGRGYATVAAAQVATAIQASGRTPVWSCGETNGASLRVAEKLGFEPVLRRVYVIVESRRP